MLPSHHRTVFECREQGRFPLFCFGFLKLLCEVQIVPTDNRVLAQAPTTFGDILLGLVRLDDLLPVSEGNGFGEFLRTFDFVELLFNRLPQAAIVQVLEDKNRFGQLPEFFQRALQRVLLGIRVEALEKL